VEDRLLSLLLDKEGSSKPLFPSDPSKWRVPSSNTRKKELDMWKDWKESGEDSTKMEPLLQSLQPLIHKRTNQFAGRVPIRKEILRAEATRKTIEGLRKFDPSRAQMHTYLTHELKGLRRYVVQHQNLSRITEDRANKIGPFLRAKDSLHERLNRAPTSVEIADYMKVPTKTVSLLELELRKDQPASLTAAAQLGEDPFVDETPRAREVIRLIKFELNPTEMQVFEYLTGDGGKPKITGTGEIAKVLSKSGSRWSDSKVSQVKAGIAKKMNKWL